MRNITFSEGEYYHLYNRGVDKRNTFSAPAEYRRFMAYLVAVNSPATAPIRYAVATKNLQGLALEIGGSRLVAIGAFCLMPNHFHLYVTPVVDNGISKFMQRLQTAYTMYFNEKHRRSGALFQGTFKAQHIDTDAYAKYLFSYIHLNPAKLKDPQWKERGPRDIGRLRDFLCTYPYSSLQEYLTRRPAITAPEAFPAYLTSVRDLDDHIDNWLHYKDAL
jgi:REP element-mobilizing transposase RayT